MDLGALAVIAPMINTADDARAFVSATRFVPVGNRSFGPRHAASLYGIDTKEYLSEFDHCSLALAMIETREAYDNLDEIIEVEGIDGVLIGPGDLSISFRQNPIPDAYGVDNYPARPRCLLHRLGRKPSLSNQVASELIINCTRCGLHLVRVRRSAEHTSEPPSP